MVINCSIDISKKSIERFTSRVCTNNCGDKTTTDTNIKARVNINLKAFFCLNILAFLMSRQKSLHVLSIAITVLYR